MTSLDHIELKALRHQSEHCSKYKRGAEEQELRHASSQTGRIRCDGEEREQFADCGKQPRQNYRTEKFAEEEQKPPDSLFIQLRRRRCQSLRLFTHLQPPPRCQCCTVAMATGMLQSKESIFSIEQTCSSSLMMQYGNQSFVLAKFYGCGRRLCFKDKRCTDTPANPS